MSVVAVYGYHSTSVRVTECSGKQLLGYTLLFSTSGGISGGRILQSPEEGSALMMLDHSRVAESVGALLSSDDRAAPQLACISRQKQAHQAAEG